MIKMKSEPKRKTNVFQNLMSIHWLMVFCFLILFSLGFVMVRLPGDNSIHDFAYDMHKSFGVLVLGLLISRIFLLLRATWKKYLKRFPKMTLEWVQVVALHGVLYLFMTAVPISGVFLSNSYKSGIVPFFGIITPDLFPQNANVVGLARSLHFWLAYAFAAFIGIHIWQQQKVVRAYWRRAISFFRLDAEQRY
jgi:cytochrome b561